MVRSRLPMPSRDNPAMSRAAAQAQGERAALLVMHAQHVQESERGVSAPPGRPDTTTLVIVLLGCPSAWHY